MDFVLLQHYLLRSCKLCLFDNVYYSARVYASSHVWFHDDLTTRGLRKAQPKRTRRRLDRGTRILRRSSVPFRRQAPFQLSLNPRPSYPQSCIFRLSTSLAGQKLKMNAATSNLVISIGAMQGELHTVLRACQRSDVYREHRDVFSFQWPAKSHSRTRKCLPMCASPTSWCKPLFSECTTSLRSRCVLRWLLL